MSEYEQILLSFVDCLRRQESFKYDRCKIIEACEVGAYAIRAIKELQDALGNMGIGGIEKNE